MRDAASIRHDCRPGAPASAPTRASVWVLVAGLAAGSCGRDRLAGATQLDRPGPSSAPEAVMVPAPVGAASSSSHDGAKDSLIVVASGPSSLPEAGSTFDLNIEIVRGSPNGAPIFLETDVPNGLTLIGGLGWETIEDAHEPVVKRTLRLRVDQPVAADITISVHANVAHGRTLASALFHLCRSGPISSSAPKSLAISTR